MIGILVSATKPSRSEAFARARAFLASVDSPTRSEIMNVYRTCLAGGCIFFRCNFIGEYVENAKVAENV